MKPKQKFTIATLSLSLLFAPCAIAQPKPTATPTLSPPDQKELEQLREEKRMQELVEKQVGESKAVGDRIQGEVDRVFNRMD